MRRPVIAAVMSPPGRHPGPGSAVTLETRARGGSCAIWTPQREVPSASSQNHLVKGENECQASTNHRL
jgi:hypothetical protein